MRTRRRVNSPLPVPGLSRKRTPTPIFGPEALPRPLPSSGVSGSAAAQSVESNGSRAPSAGKGVPPSEKHASVIVVALPPLAAPLMGVRYATGRSLTLARALMAVPSVPVCQRERHTVREVGRQLSGYAWLRGSALSHVIEPRTSGAGGKAPLLSTPSLSAQSGGGGEGTGGEGGGATGGAGGGELASSVKLHSVPCIHSRLVSPPGCMSTRQYTVESGLIRLLGGVAIFASPFSVATWNSAPALAPAITRCVPPAPEPSPAPSAKLGSHRCLRRTLIRDGYEAFSSVLGALEEGDVVRVVEERALEIGASRLRFERVRTPPHPLSLLAAAAPALLVRGC